MAQEISVSTFERNLKMYNRKGLRRRFSSVYDHEGEYLKAKPLGVTPKYVLEVIIDKDYVLDFQELLKKENFKIVGDVNYIHIEKIVNDYHENEALYSSSKEAIEAFEKDYKNILANIKDYKEVENDDCSFYFLPYNDNISNICQFIEEEKDKILSYAKEKDVTIIMNLIGFSSIIKGFIGFNFYDADQNDKEVVVDYTSNFTINLDFAKGATVYNTAILLKGLSDNEEDIELINCHIFAENVRFK